MLLQNVLVGLIATTSFVLADDPVEPTRTKRFHRKEAWETEYPEIASQYHSDMKSLRHSIHENPMYTSMRDVLKTAIPSSEKKAMHTNPSSLFNKYKSNPPTWYSKLPKDVQEFMESNREAMKSVRSKDLGTLTKNDMPKETSRSKKSKDKEAASSKEVKKSEANGLGVVTATIGTLAGAMGVAMLLL